MNPISTNNEAARLEALGEYQILDTEPEEVYDNIVKLAAFICDTPIAFVNFIDEHRHWFKAKVGLEVSEIPRNVESSYLCQEQQGVVVISDSLVEAKADNSVVIGYPDVLFYAGIALKNPQGYMLGTLCVIDTIPRELSQKQMESLEALSRLVMNQLELRRKAITEQQRALSDRQRVEEEMNYPALLHFVTLRER